MTPEKVSKVVIPAAGLGTRFLPMTKAQPKEMLPVVDKPVIQYVVEEAVASGIDDILIITGRGKRAIEDHFDRSFELEYRLKESGNLELYSETDDISNLAEIHYIRQKEPKGLGHAILCAEKHCNGEPFAVLLGDTITVPYPGHQPCTAQMVEAFGECGSSIIAIEEVKREKIQDYGIIDGREVRSGLYKIHAIVEKPKPNEAPSNLASIGRYVLTPDIFDILHGTQPGYGGEIQLTDAIQQLPTKMGLVTRCTRYDIGDKLGWLKANLEFCLQREEYNDEILEFLTSLQTKRRVKQPGK
ncbi:MAG TPA: UTP--glucose-1-phosphate uridylyltransferase GalU [Methanolinea sp.]|nr:UTP--glucose-1-phosphate uridylyltransferase GalU [Methanolinea sp.]HQK56300.1 UTP--glucose-1-phosphate uridylyltransferase GalU [Methanolinea sp.]